MPLSAPMKIAAPARLRRPLEHLQHPLFFIERAEELADLGDVLRPDRLLEKRALAFDAQLGAARQHRHRLRAHREPHARGLFERRPVRAPARRAQPGARFLQRQIAEEQS